ncbi:MAG TPA: ATP-dependent 6-phosphofructokinase [Polyangiaceae bacterium]|jgi:6-phosphofructokinase 1
MPALSRGDRIALLTSGGDAPGMNAALRGAARVATSLGFEVMGVEDGYVGLLAGRVRPLPTAEVDEAARRGGTVLGSARSKAFPTPEGQRLARAALAAHAVKALVVIGGNGSLTGARTLCDAVAVAGLPASIDNDLACTSMAIGVDTALNTIVDACDRIADTAGAHRRTFFVEVMGRDCGYLAMTSAIASGADAVLVPEAGRDEEAIVDGVARAMEAAYARDSGKRRVLVVKAEGVRLDAATLKERIDARVRGSLPDVDTRVTVLGHVVRGGTPTAFDRLLGARLANAAVRALAEGETSFMAGWYGPGVTRSACRYDPYVVLSPLDEVLAETARLMRGESDIARWRRAIVAEIEPILAR